MKRAYRQVSLVAADGAFGVALDGRPLRTPGRAPLRLPTRALAEAVAAEWEAQAERVRPETMPMTRLAATAIDRVGRARAEVAANVAGYGGTDLVCYLAEGDARLRRRQQRRWRPFRDWLRRRHGVALAVTEGIVPVAQPPKALAALAALVEARDDFALTALADLVAITGSLAVGLALAEGAFDLETGWRAAFVDELHQAETWGEDAEAAARRRRLKRELAEALRFLALVDAERPAKP